MDILNVIQLYAFYKRFTLDSKTQKAENKRMEKIDHSNSKQKRTGVAILSDKIDFKAKIVTRAKKGIL